MRWPWTSVARLDDLRAATGDRVRAQQNTIDWLQDQNEKLADKIMRIERHQAGMYETPRPERPSIKPPPKELLEYIDGFDSGSLRKSMRDNVFRRHGRGESWDSIVEEIMSPSTEELGVNGTA